MNYLIDFKNALSKRIKQRKIECEFYEEVKCKEDIFLYSKITTPVYIEEYISNYKPVIKKTHK